MPSNLHPRGIAASLLLGALKIAPPQAAEWGRAMLNELHHVEGAAGLLISNSVLYFVYRPYAQILKNYLETGDSSGMSAFSEFLSRAEVPLDLPIRPNFSVHFWTAVIALCAMSLLIATLRFVSERRHHAAI